MPGRLMRGSKFRGHVIARAEVDLIGRLTAKGGVGHHAVVLRDVKRGQACDGLHGVERVEIEPLVAQGSPEGLYPLPIL